MERKTDYYENTADIANKTSAKAPVFFKKNRFIVRFYDNETPEWIVNSLSMNGTELVINFNLCESHNAAKIFYKKMRMVDKFSIEIGFLDEVGCDIGKISISDVWVKKIDNKLNLSYEDDSNVNMSVVFNIDEKNINYA